MTILEGLCLLNTALLLSCLAALIHKAPKPEYREVTEIEKPSKPEGKLIFGTKKPPKYHDEGWEIKRELENNSGT